jgi:hypothetical protein
MSSELRTITCCAMLFLTGCSFCLGQQSRSAGSTSVRLALILNAMYRHPISTATSLGIMLIGLPVYWVWRKSSYSRIADVNPLL